MSNASFGNKTDKIALPNDFFSNSSDPQTKKIILYECLKCARGQNKPLSYHDKSRQNLRKHTAVRRRHTLTLQVAVLS